MTYEKSKRINEKATLLAMYLGLGLRLHKKGQLSLAEIVEGALKAVRYRDKETEYIKAPARLRTHKHTIDLLS